MPPTNVKWFIPARKALKSDTFKNYLTAIFTMFPESQAKLLANSFIGELGRKYSRKDYGFVCQSMDTAQCIWISALAENRDITIDSYKNLNTKNELFLIRERRIERILSDSTSINRFVISQAILKCLNIMWDNWTEHSKLHAINTDGILTNCKDEYPNKKEVEFEIDHIGTMFQTDSNVTYFEKHYRENLNPDNYTDYMGNGTIYYGGAGCGKTYKLCQSASEAEDPIILSFTNKATENVTSVLRKKYRNYELAKKCYTFDLYFCDYHGRDLSALEDKTIFIDEYSMVPNSWMTKVYQAFTKYHNQIYMFGDTNQCDPDETTKVHYNYFKSVAVSEMCPRRVSMKYVAGNSRYDEPTRVMLDNILKTRKVTHSFEPPQPSDVNICHLNKTRRKVTEECCIRFSEGKDPTLVSFKYQGRCDNTMCVKICHYS